MKMEFCFLIRRQQCKVILQRQTLKLTFLSFHSQDFQQKEKRKEKREKKGKEGRTTNFLGR